MGEKPLFIPLKTEYYEAFTEGKKNTEYRRYGPRWNETTCRIGRRVIIAKGYGKQHRRSGLIVGFSKEEMTTDDWIACYEKPGIAACIKIELNEVNQ